MQMDETLWHKFTQYPDLKQRLLSTGDAELLHVCSVPSSNDKPQTMTDVVPEFQQRRLLGTGRRSARPQRARKSARKVKNQIARQLDDLKVPILSSSPSSFSYVPEHHPYDIYNIIKEPTHESYSITILRVK
jgi:predicted NAD-dependent protein-ADP-ribosyltransferase YbiA (DUF1768 family)